MANFKEGVIVRLMSGGPRMTIVEIMPTGKHFRCTWFSGNKLENGYFPAEALVTPKKHKVTKQVN